MEYETSVTHPLFFLSPAALGACFVPVLTLQSQAGPVRPPPFQPTAPGVLFSFSLSFPPPFTSFQPQPPRVFPSDQRDLFSLPRSFRKICHSLDLPSDSIFPLFVYSPLRKRATGLPLMYVRVALEGLRTVFWDTIAGEPDSMAASERENLQRVVLYDLSWLESPCNRAMKALLLAQRRRAT
jgi:hypothetical protein